jgi:hypothetical protein
MAKKIQEANANYFRPCSSHGMMAIREGEIIKGHYIVWSNDLTIWSRPGDHLIGKEYNPYSMRCVILKPFQAIVNIK